MKTLIIFNHPHESSYCQAILKAVKRGLKKGGHPCKTINLDKDRFDPVMREKDLLAFVVYGKTGDITQADVDPHVLRYKEKLEWISLNMVKQSSQDMREFWLEEIEEKFAMLECK